MWFEDRDVKSDSDRRFDFDGDGKLNSSEQFYKDDYEDDYLEFFAKKGSYDDGYYSYDDDEDDDGYDDSDDDRYSRHYYSYKKESDYVEYSESDGCKKAPYGAYYDKFRVLRYDGKRINKRFNADGDEVYTDLRGKEIVNLTKEKAKEREKEAIKNGEKYYLRQIYKKGLYGPIGVKDIQGNRYCEVSYDEAKPTNEDVFVIRDLKYKNEHYTYRGSFYIGASLTNQYKIIAPTDYTKKRDLKRYGEQIEEFYKLLYILFDYKCDKDFKWKVGLRKSEGEHYLGETEVTDEVQRIMDMWTE